MKILLKANTEQKEIAKLLGVSESTVCRGKSATLIGEMALTGLPMSNEKPMNASKIKYAPACLRPRLRHSWRSTWKWT
jgi:transposase